jgi:hypothetical protein
MQKNSTTSYENAWCFIELTSTHREESLRGISIDRPAFPKILCNLIVCVFTTCVPEKKLTIVIRQVGYNLNWCIQRIELKVVSSSDDPP